MASLAPGDKKPVSASRGRGRARTLGAIISSPGASLGGRKYTPITNTKVEVDPFKPVEESLLLCLRETNKENLDSCLSKVDEFATYDERIKKFISSLFEKCLSKKDYAENGGQVVAVLMSSGKIGPEFRRIFFGKFQETYKTRDELWKNEFAKYLSFSVFLCSIYKFVLVNGQVLKILTKPVYSILNEMIDGKNMDIMQWERGITVFKENLVLVAALLQDSDKAQMDELFKKVRSKIIKGASPVILCILLETFECYIKGDWTVASESKEMYSEIMMELME